MSRRRCMFRGEEIPIDDYDVECLTRHGGFDPSPRIPPRRSPLSDEENLLASDAFLTRFD